MKNADVEQLPVLDARAITPHQLQALSQLFDHIAGDEIQRLPAMADCPAPAAWTTTSPKSCTCPTSTACAASWPRSPW